MPTIFYSWQTDLSPRCNRNLIEKALERAVKALRKNPDIDAAARDDLRVDKDTKGMAGSPDIAATILQKIEAADACVFDVSIAIREKERGTLSKLLDRLLRRPPRRTQRPSPNPNVLIELGYAFKALGQDRVIMVFNSAFGEVEELPFDLRMKRALCYSATESDDLAEKRTKLAGLLQSALQEVYLRSEDQRFSQEAHRFYLTLFSSVRSFLDEAAELDARRLSPWVDEFRANCGRTANHLRDLSVEDVATSDLALRSDMTNAADALDELARWEAVLGDGGKFDDAVRGATDQVAPLIEPCLPALKIRFAKDDHESTKRRLSRRAVADFERFAAALEQKDGRTLTDTRGELSRLGGELLQLGAELEVVGDRDAARLRRCGHALRVAQIRGTEQIGFRPEIGLRDRLRPLIDELRPLTNGT